MMWIIGALTGAFLFASGWWIGRKTRPEHPDTDAELAEEIAERNKQWDALMSYTGRRR